MSRNTSCDMTVNNVDDAALNRANVDCVLMYITMTTI